MKEKRGNYVKPQSYTIETEQPLLSGSSLGVNTTTSEYKPGPCEVRRYEDYEEEEEDDWSK